MSNYDRNMKAIRTKFPALAGWIEREPDSDWLTPYGKGNALIFHSKGRIPMYEEKHPGLEPSRMARKLKDALHKDKVSIVVGLGLGYFVQALLRFSEKGHTVVVVEPVAHMVRECLKTIDLSKEIEKETLILCPGRDDLAFMAARLDENHVQGWSMFVDPYTIYRSEYAEPSNYTASIVNQIHCSVGTLVSAGEAIAANDIESFPYLIRCRGAIELKGLYFGFPGVTVSTGPSLSRNIHLLKDFQDRIVIVAVGQALRPLLAHDIRPDFFCTVDFGEPNMTHFEGLMDSGVPMVCLNQTYAPLLTRYRGLKFVVASQSGAGSEDVTALMQGKGNLEVGGSVAHFAFQFALLLGCDPVIFVGQDLALTGGRSHTRQADVGGSIELEGPEIVWKVEDPRSDLSDSKKYARGHSMGPAVYAPGYYQEPVVTNIGLQSFRVTLEAMIKQSSVKVVNATEGGAMIRGAEPMWLDEALEKFCTRKKPPWKAPTPYADDGDTLAWKAIPVLEKNLKTLELIEEHSRKAIEVLPKMLRSWNNPRRLEEFAKVNETEAKAAQVEAQKNPLVTLAIFGASRAIASREKKVRGDLPHLKKHKKNLKIRVERSRLILEAAQKAAEKLTPTYRKALSLLEQYAKTRDPKILDPARSIPPEDPNLTDAEMLFAIGNWAKTLLEARKGIGTGLDGATGIETRALAMREESIRVESELREREREEKNDRLCLYHYLIREGLRLGREGQQEEKLLEANIERFRRAKEIYPDGKEARWGLATTLHFSGDDEWSLKEYDELVEKWPDLKRFAFERGQVMLKLGKIQEGLDAIRVVMEETKEFDSFLPVLAGLYEQHESLLDEALLAYDTYLKECPKDHSVVAQRSALLSRMGKEEDAERGMVEAAAILQVKALET